MPPLDFGPLTASNDPVPSSVEVPLAERPRTIRDWLRRFSINDWLLLFYLTYLTTAVYFAEPGASGDARAKGLSDLLALAGAFVLLSLVLVRGGIVHRSLPTAAFYRVGHFGGLMGSYSAMRGFLPVVNPGEIDRELLKFDMTVFGLEPSLTLDAWITPWATEWFAFFYFSYFFLLALHAFPILFVGRNARLVAEFSLGLTFVVALGQALYLVAPGFGPAVATPELFRHQLPNGIWWNQVKLLVATAGAQKDIFPSIHTAAPSFILLFSFRNRRHAPYRYTWPLLAFFVANIIVATMYLRWHWLADIVAGIALAFLAHVVSVWASSREAQWRQRHGLGAVWPPWPVSFKQWRKPASLRAPTR